MKRRLDGDQIHAAVAPRLKGALIYQVHRLPAGAVPPRRRWGELCVDSCSTLMCAWAIALHADLASFAPVFDNARGEEELRPQAAANHNSTCVRV